MNTSNPKIHINTQRGFALIEALITVIVVSVGLLGMAGMQLNSLRANQDAHYNSQAALLAADLGDRMRGNTQAAKDGFYAHDKINAVADPGFDCSADFPEGSTRCNPQQLAEADLYEWYGKVDPRLWDTNPQNILPGGKAEVLCLDDCSDGAYRIKIEWDQNRDGVIDTTGTLNESGGTDADPSITVELLP